jgi:hypothetical protein
MISLNRVPYFIPNFRVEVEIGNVINFGGSRHDGEEEA